jgi:MFS family permease
MNQVIFKNKELRSKILRIGIAESISAVGDWITMMAVLALLVFRGNGGVAASSGIFLAGLLPVLPASLIAGKLCDRFDRKKLMIISQLLSAVVVSGLVFAESTWVIYTLLALEAVTISVMTPARQSALPLLVSRDELTHANAFLQQLAAIVKIGAPMLAGLVLTVLNPHQAILFDVASFFIAAFILRGLPALRTPQTVKDENTLQPARQAGILEGFRQAPGLKILFISIFCGVFVIVGFDVLASVFIRDVLRQNESFMGLTVGLIGLGTLVSSGLLLLRKAAVNHWKDIAAGILLLAVIPFSLALVTPLGSSPLARIVALTGCLVGGIGNGLINIQAGTLLQTLSPVESLGRISGAFQSTAVAGQLLGTVLTPLLVPDAAAMKPYFIISTTALLLLAIFLILQLKWWERSAPLEPTHQTGEVVK